MGKHHPRLAENFSGSMPMGVSILDDNGNTLISLAGPDTSAYQHARDAGTLWFSYTAGYRELVENAGTFVIEHCLFSTAGRCPERIRILVPNALLLNLLTGIALFTMARMCNGEFSYPLNRRITSGRARAVQP